MNTDKLLCALASAGVVSVIVATGSASAALIATEVGNNAPGSDGDNEYVVIFNTGPSSVDLGGFKIDDVAGGSAEVVLSSFVLDAGVSLVISSGADQATLETVWEQTLPSGANFVIEGALPGFNNTGTDAVRILDASDTVLYTFEYTATLGGDDPPIAIGLGPSGGSGGTSIVPFSTVVAPIPEPASVALLGAGCLLIEQPGHDTRQTPCMHPDTQRVLQEIVCCSNLALAELNQDPIGIAAERHLGDNIAVIGFTRRFDQLDAGRLQLLV